MNPDVLLSEADWLRNLTEIQQAAARDYSNFTVKGMATGAMTDIFQHSGIYCTMTISISPKP
jgi:hypothetical protein